MKVHGGKGTGKVGLYIKNKVEKKKSGTITANFADNKPADCVEISKQSSEIIKAKEVISEQPEVRTEVVNEVKRKVREGTYKVNSEKVAEKIIKENILDELL